jgi:GNAT superfamily N-acetyltransferase
MASTAPRRVSIGRAGHVRGAVRQLNPRSEAENRLASQLTLSPAAWTAGWFIADELRGVVRAGAASRGGPVEAELFVEEGWRRQGIGSMLLKETQDWARRGEAATLRLVCDRADWPMRHFAERFGARLDLVFGQMVADIPLVQP